MVGVKRRQKKSYTYIMDSSIDITFSRMLLGSSWAIQLWF